MSSGEESDNEDIPETPVCQKLCEDFAEITGTDTACAQFYLQDRKWNLEHSLNDFFEDRKNKGALRVNDKKEAEVVVVLDGSSSGLAAAATAVLVETTLSRSRESTSQEAKVQEEGEGEHPSRMRFITWNVDGLNDKNLKLRTKAVCKHILNEHADVVFVQEVIPETAAYFLSHLTDYHCSFGNEVGYFVGTFLRKASVRFQDSDIIPFPETRMMRNALRINASFGNIPLCLMNSHLESTSEGAEERKIQLRNVFKEMLRTSDDRTVVFAGDTNLRDKELDAVGGVPAGIEDMWLSCGRRKECSYTFDTLRNDNLVVSGRFKPRFRFDRVYVRHASPARLRPLHFGLIGLERLLPHRCFPSDHWGILCHFGGQP